MKKRRVQRSVSFSDDLEDVCPIQQLNRTHSRELFYQKEDFHRFKEEFLNPSRGRHWAQRTLCNNRSSCDRWDAPIERDMQKRRRSDSSLSSPRHDRWASSSHVSCDLPVAMRSIRKRRRKLGHQMTRRLGEAELTAPKDEKHSACNTKINGKAS